MSSRVSRYVAATVLLLTCSGPATAQRDGIRPQPDGGYSLDMLTSSQQAELERRIETFALATSMLNHCGRPQATERRALAAAQGCVEAASLTTITKRFADKLAEVSRDARWNCRSQDNIRLMARMEHAIALTIQDIRDACRK